MAFVRGCLSEILCCLPEKSIALPITEGANYYTKSDSLKSGFQEHSITTDPGTLHLEKYEYVAENILELLLSASRSTVADEEFQMKLKKYFRKDTENASGMISVTSWAANIAIRLLSAIESMVKTALTEAQNSLPFPEGSAMKSAFETALTEASDFVHNHPYFCTLIAIGMAAFLMPWVLEIIGFGELGPVEGSFAALWQSRYAGFVPKGSLFSFLQRCGMAYGRVAQAHRNERYAAASASGLETMAWKRINV